MQRHAAIICGECDITKHFIARFSHWRVINYGLIGKHIPIDCHPAGIIRYSSVPRWAHDLLETCCRDDTVE